MSTKPEAPAHTPGPWRVSWDECKIVGAQAHRDCLIAYTDSPGNHHDDAGNLVRGADTQRANARLIAAAPDLLEALRMVLAIICEKERCGHFLPEEIRSVAEPAIQKAEGRP